MPSIRALVIGAAAAAVAATAAAAAALDCGAIRPDPAHPEWVVDLRADFAQPLVLAKSEDTPPSVTDTQVALDLCRPLPADKPDACAPGTSVCLTVGNTRDGLRRVEYVIPAGGQAGSSEAAARIERAQFAGARSAFALVVPGGAWGGRAQSTAIEFACDAQAGQPEFGGYDPAAGRLRLTWRTVHACPGARPGAPRRGFPLVTIVVVVAVLYLVGGMWYNHTQYGASGWDLVPHRDFWREAPYLARDAVQHVVRAATSSASRGAGHYEQI